VRLLELLGLLGPVAALGLLVMWWRRIPARPRALAVVGLMLALAASALAVVGGRLIWLGGSDGVEERLEAVTAWRWAALACAVLLLSVANLVGREPASRSWGWLAGGWSLVIAGAVVAGLGGLLTDALSEDPESGLATVAQITSDTVQFAALGLGVVALAVGVAARRGGDAPDAGAQVVDLAGRAWRAYSAYRGPRR